jgi:hypothetical protein
VFDVLYLLITIGFFALMGAYSRAGARLGREGRNPNER